MSAEHSVLGGAAKEGATIGDAETLSEGTSIALPSWGLRSLVGVGREVSIEATNWFKQGKSI